METAFSPETRFPHVNKGACFPSEHAFLCKRGNRLYYEISFVSEIWKRSLWKQGFLYRNVLSNGNRLSYIERDFLVRMIVLRKLASLM